MTTENEIINSIALKHKKYSHLTLEEKSNPDLLVKLVTANPLVIKHVIKFFVKRIGHSESKSINIEFLNELIMKAVTATPAVFTVIPISFVTKELVETMTEYMKANNSYIESWIVNIPTSFRTVEFMTDAVKANPSISKNKDKYWLTPEGLEILKTVEHIERKKRNSLFKCIQT